jgi:hypothetical protein
MSGLRVLVVGASIAGKSNFTNHDLEHQKLTDEQQALQLRIGW